jgi:hypothetical protein
LVAALCRGRVAEISFAEITVHYLQNVSTVEEIGMSDRLSANRFVETRKHPQLKRPPIAVPVHGPAPPPIPPPVQPKNQKLPKAASDVPCLQADAFLEAMPPFTWLAWSSLFGLATFVLLAIGWAFAAVTTSAEDEGKKLATALQSTMNYAVPLSSPSQQEPGIIENESGAKVQLVVNRTQLDEWKQHPPIHKIPAQLRPSGSPLFVAATGTSQNANRAPTVAPVPRENVISSEAFEGEQYGIGKINVLFGKDRPQLHADQTVFVVDDENRVRYPAISPSRNDSGQLIALDVHFLVLGNEPLQNVRVVWGDTAPIDVGDVQLQSSSEYDQRIRNWWKIYINPATPLMGNQKEVALQMRQVLANRLALGLPTDESSQKNSSDIEVQFERMISTLFGIDSLLLSMPNRSLQNGVSSGEHANLPLPQPLTLRSVALPSVPRSVSVETLAYAVPEECFYVRCQKLADYRWLRSLVTDWGGSLEEIVSTPTLDRRIRDKQEHQLAINLGQSEALDIESACSDMAIIGCDFLFEEGAAIGVLFEARNSAALTRIISKQRAAALERPGVKEKNISLGSGTANLISSEDNRVRSFYSVFGRYHLVTNSQYIASRFHEAITGRRSLGKLGEFRVARHKVPVKQSSRAFIFMSDPFFRNLATPHYRIELLRRAAAIAELEQIEVANMMALQEGHNDMTMAELIDAAYLPVHFGDRSDGSQPLKHGSSFVDSKRGRRGTFGPTQNSDAQRSGGNEYQTFPQCPLTAISATSKSDTPSAVWMW